MNDVKCNWCLKILDWMAMFWSPAYTWKPAGLRRAYVLTYPLSVFVRVALVCLLLVSGVTSAWICALVYYLKYTWEGREFRW